jgi:hypothetical protein
VISSSQGGMISEHLLEGMCKEAAMF